MNKQTWEEEFDEYFEVPEEYRKCHKVYDPNNNGICVLCGFNPDYYKKFAKDYIKKNFIHKEEVKKELKKIAKEIDDSIVNGKSLGLANGYDVCNRQNINKLLNADI